MRRQSGRGSSSCSSGMNRLREERRLIDRRPSRRRAVRLANLAQDGKHMLLAGQGSKHRAFRQRLELVRGYFEALDEFVVVSN